MKHFPPSELILNSDGSIFHLHLKPEQLADNVILVGDPGRVALVAEYFDTQECSVSSREFNTITGTYKGKRISVISTGIGTDNIDIVMNELDALSNIDLENRTEKKDFRQLTIIRIGTSGGMQPEIPLGSFLISEKSIGFDGMLNFYAGRDCVSDLAFEKTLKEQLDWNPQLAAPYVVDADEELIQRIGKNDMLRGVTISANGFYGPQGRVLRIDLADMHLNDKIERFRYGNYKITNYEMEGSAIAGLAKLMGHKAMTVCCIIANRRVEAANTDYKPYIEKLVTTVLERI
ncbi:purine or other phosphorylase family 1 [Paludibacter propionicigenes WB4]|uniref:Uridine phosphorylase n=1 Tax=Paludibacter propionicigenes (strain DSM 17365 / JCM 13257 / WB4) TaxID=694427 RepID=E4T1J0_PALPW|nr:nucleoside phosphorylase [Paludibacter propionicigenes]ADQ78584.1 purine or other phosphorylase family 1 [Paludibacter propionicigenes WB4]